MSEVNRSNERSNERTNERSSAANEKPDDAHPLDHVVWSALTSKQSHLALGNDHVLRYPGSVAPFAGMTDSSAGSFDVLRPLIVEHGPVALVTTREVVPPAGFSILRRSVLHQMIWQGTNERSEFQHVGLSERDVPDMLALTALTEPGPFGPRTIELGQYIGVRSEGKLAAMAGERMKLDGFTEISAVCVNPEFRGRGYAAALMKQLISNIDSRGETPYLHVLDTNHAAIAIYRTLGFINRRDMQLGVFGVEQV
jgi:ribosomal protein S18 acetylase RimI-like enzyme